MEIRALPHIWIVYIVYDKWNPPLPFRPNMSQIFGIITFPIMPIRERPSDQKKLYRKSMAIHPFSQQYF